MNVKLKKKELVQIHQIPVGGTFRYPNGLIVFIKNSDSGITSLNTGKYYAPLTHTYYDSDLVEPVNGSFVEE